MAAEPAEPPKPPQIQSDVVWGYDATLPARALEAEALAKLLRRTVSKPRHGEPNDEFRSSLLALGDFNITKSTT